MKTPFFVIIKTAARHWFLTKIFRNVSCRGFRVSLTSSLIQKRISRILFIVLNGSVLIEVVSETCICFVLLSCSADFHYGKLDRNYWALNTIDISSKSLLTNIINNLRETFAHTSFNNSHFSFWRKLCVQTFNKYTANRFLFWVSITQKILRMVSLISNDRACWRTLPQQNLRILKRHRLYGTMCRMLPYSETFPSNGER